ncbi:MAG: DegT/DnrJ/EryC1/StrS family aminotransferase [Deltaproteobacteria bacterium]|nr:DegT/DnrJ/EryC1/StrS family aminotransferase [Deltaproteobacteria bacterium]
MIPQNNPLANYLALGEEIDDALQRVLASGWYILGKETEAFEREFADFVDARYAVGMANGTEAICLALKAFGIGRGDRVLTVSHTAVATVSAIEMCGAVPVLVDIDPATHTLDPGLLENALTENTKAIVPVHLYGRPAYLRPLLDFARQHGLVLIEDCAQAHGAMVEGRRVGSWGDAGTFSFYPTKNLGALGDGGAVTTSRPEIHERLLALRQYGWNEKRISCIQGFNSRLDELQSAVLRVKLRHLDANNQKRIHLAGTYTDQLKSLPITLPSEVAGVTHVYHQYVLQCREKSIRDDLMGFLGKGGIQCAIHYPVPVHLQPFYLDRFGKCDSLPITERACERILSLPMFPELDPKDMDTICTRIREFFGAPGQRHAS